MGIHLPPFFFSVVALTVWERVQDLPAAAGLTIKDTPAGSVVVAAEEAD